jgi:hypothetical protein
VVTNLLTRMTMHPLHRGCGQPGPDFPFCEMERREAPGVCETPYDEPLREVRPRAVETDCESVPRGARVMHRWGCEAHRANAAPPGAPPPASESEGLEVFAPPRHDRGEA